jgi:hypothetical protein
MTWIPSSLLILQPRITSVLGQTSIFEKDLRKREGSVDVADVYVSCHLLRPCKFKNRMFGKEQRFCGPFNLLFLFVNIRHFQGGYKIKPKASKTHCAPPLYIAN